MAVVEDVVVKLEAITAQHDRNIRRAEEVWRSYEANVLQASTNAEAAVKRAKRGIGGAVVRGARTVTQSNKDLVAALDGNSDKIVKAQMRQTESIVSSLEKIENKFDATRDSVAGSGQGIRRAIAGISLALIGREVTEYADQFVDLRNKIAAAGEVAGRQGQGVIELAEQAREARSKIEPYVDLYSRILRASAGVAESEEEVARATNLVAKAFAAGGASAQEQAAGVTQLGQALGSGFLQGDELRSIGENAPLVAKAIADAVGVSVGELKELGAQGQLTSEVVFEALLSAGEDIEAAFAATIPRASDAARLAFDNLTLRIGEYLQEAGTVRTVSEATAAAINFVAENLDAFALAATVAAAAAAGFFGAKGIGAAGAAVKALSADLAILTVNAGRTTVSLRGAAAAARAFTLAAGPIALTTAVVTAAAAGFALLANNADGARMVSTEYRTEVDALAGAVEAYSAATKKANELTGQAAIVAKEDAAVKRAQTEETLKSAKAKIAEAEATIAQLEAETRRAAARDVRQKGVSLNVEIRNSNQINQLKTDIEALSEQVKEAEGALANPLGGVSVRGIDTPDIDTTALKVAQGALKAAQAELEAATAAGVEASVDRAERRVQELQKAIELINKGVEGQAANRIARDAVSDDEPDRSRSGRSDRKSPEERARERLIRQVEDNAKTERQKIEENRMAAIAAIEASHRPLEERRRLIAQANAQAFVASATLVDQAEKEARAARIAGEEEKAILKEIEAVQARMHGRTLEAEQLEREAARIRLEAELEGLEGIARKEAELRLARLEGEAQRSEGEALRQFDALTEEEDDGGSLQAELARIQEREAEKLALLEELRGTELEALRDFEAKKTEIERQADEERTQARRAAASAQFDAVQGTVGDISTIIAQGAGEQSTAARAAAKAEQGIALGRAIVNTAGSIAETINIWGFPLAIPFVAQAAAVGGAQIAAIAAQSFARGGIDIQGPGTTTSDSIPANLSRGESVITALGTERNRDILRMANAGVDVERALTQPVFQMPDISIPALPAQTNSTTISMGAPQLIVQGNVANDTLPRLEAQFKEMRRNFASDVVKVMRNRERVTTPRTERTVGRR